MPMLQIKRHKSTCDSIYRPRRKFLIFMLNKTYHLITIGIGMSCIHDTDKTKMLKSLIEFKSQRSR